MAGLKPTFEGVINSINKYISLIPMCFVSWLVWLMIHNPYYVIVLITLGFWFSIPLIIWAIVVFLQSFFTKGIMWKLYLIWGCAIIILIGAFFISPTRFGTICNPDIMAEHYDKNKSGIQNLIDYTNQSLDKGALMQLEFEFGKISMFHVRGKNDSIWSNNWDVSSEDRDSLMQVVGLDYEEFKNIRRQLKKLGCISIETATTHSDFVDIGFRRVGMGMYSYRIYNRPMNAEEINDYNEDEMFIPYTDRVLFEYGGGVFGPQIFGDEREEFMKKHPVK